MTSPDDVSGEAALAAAQEVWQRAFDFARAENEADLRRAESRFAEVLKAEQGERDRLVLETVQVGLHMWVVSS
jgi:regulator of protease activity HflC (stomatin/prohibitin superfamily)